MADLLTGNSFDEYSVFVEPVANGWKGLSIQDCLDIFAVEDEHVVKQLGLYKLVRFCQLLELPADTNLITFKFEEYVPRSGVSAPCVRQQENEETNQAEYIVQIDDHAIGLMANKQRFAITSEIQKIAMGTEKYEVPCFVFTLPEEVQANENEFPVKISFALKVDPAKVEGVDSATANENLVACFKQSPSHPTTLSLVAEFYRNLNFTLARDLQPGLYPFTSFEITEQSKTEDGKVRKWKNVILSCLDGTRINFAASSKIGQLFLSPLVTRRYEEFLKTSPLTLYVAEVEVKERKDGTTVKSVHGTVFFQVPAGIEQKMKQITAAQPMKSAALPTSASVESTSVPMSSTPTPPPIPTLAPTMLTTVTEPQQQVLPLTNATETKKSKTRAATQVVAMPEVKEMNSEDLPEFNF